MKERERRGWIDLHSHGDSKISENIKEKTREKDRGIGERKSRVID